MTQVLHFSTTKTTFDRAVDIENFVGVQWTSGHFPPCPGFSKVLGCDVTCSELKVKHSVKSFFLYT